MIEGEGVYMHTAKPVQSHMWVPLMKISSLSHDRFDRLLLSRVTIAKLSCLWNAQNQCGFQSL